MARPLPPSLSGRATNKITFFAASPTEPRGIRVSHNDSGGILHILIVGHCLTHATVLLDGHSKKLVNVWSYRKFSPVFALNKCLKQIKSPCAPASEIPFDTNTMVLTWFSWFKIMIHNLQDCRSGWRQDPTVRIRILIFLNNQTNLRINNHSINIKEKIVKIHNITLERC